MANETEKLQVEFGRNERWQAKTGKSYSSSLPIARYLHMKGRAVKGRSHISAQDKRRIASLRKRLDPSNY